MRHLELWFYWCSFSKWDLKVGERMSQLVDPKDRTMVDGYDMSDKPWYKSDKYSIRVSMLRTRIVYCISNKMPRALNYLPPLSQCGWLKPSRVEMVGVMLMLPLETSDSHPEELLIGTAWKDILSKCPTHQILQIKHPNCCLSTALRRV